MNKLLVTCRKFLVALFLCAVIVAVNGSEDIELVNPGFEEDLHGWQKLSPQLSKQYPLITQQALGEAAYSGAMGLRISAKEATKETGSYAYTGTYPAFAGKTYEISFMGRIVDGDGFGAVYLKFSDDKKKDLVIGYEQQKEFKCFPIELDRKAREWKQYTRRYVAPPGTAFLSINIAIYSNHVSTIDIDDIRVSLIGE